MKIKFLSMNFFFVRFHYLDFLIQNSVEVFKVISIQFKSASFKCQEASKLLNIVLIRK